MADEIQKPFLDKVSDGLSTLGSNISSGVSNFLDKSSQGQQDLANLSDADRASVVAGDFSPLYKQQNFAGVAANLNAQTPTPLSTVENPEPYFPDLVSQAKNQLITSAGALGNQAPLNQGLQDAALGGISAYPVNEDAKGAGPKRDVLPVAPPISAEQISNAGKPAGMYNPYAAGFNVQQSGIQDTMDAGKKMAVAENTFATESKRLNDLMAIDMKAKQDKFEFEFQDKMDDLDKSMKDFRALAGDKIIPGAFLARQDTQGSIMTGLAVALGGIGGALQGTNKNIGLEMIEKAIDKDIAAQQFNADYKYKVSKAGIDDQNTLLSKMREKFSDDKSAILASKAVLLASAQDQMNMTLTKQGGARDLAVQGQGKMALGQLAEKRANIEMQLKAAQQEAQMKKDISANLSGSRKKWGDLEIQAYEKLTGDKSIRDRMVPNWGPATNKSLAEDFTKANTEIESGLQSISRIKELTNGFNKITDFATRRKLEAVQTALVGNLRLPYTGPGILTDSEKAVLLNIIGNPAKLLSLSSVEAAGLSEVERKLRVDQKNRAKGAGLEYDNIESKEVPIK
jgi:hypothetical protein